MRRTVAHILRSQETTICHCERSIAKHDVVVVFTKAVASDGSNWCCQPCANEILLGYRNWSDGRNG